jgi:hypothetical protein
MIICYCCFQDYGRKGDGKEHLADKHKEKAVGDNLHLKVDQDQQQKNGDSTWKHDGFFQLEEEAPLAKRRPPFQETKMTQVQESAPSVTELDSRSWKPDQPGTTAAMMREGHPITHGDLKIAGHLWGQKIEVSEGNFLSTGEMALDMDMIQGEEFLVGDKWTETGFTTQMAGEATNIRLLVIREKNGSMAFMIRQIEAQLQRPRKSRLLKLKHCWRCSYLLYLNDVIWDG